MFMADFTPITQCDLCGSGDLVIWYDDMRDTALSVPGSFGIVRCSHCGLAFLSPQPGEHALAAYYPDAYVPYQKSNILVRAFKRLQWAREEAMMRRVLGGPKSVLEVGCSRGEFLAYLASRGWRVRGIEMDPASAAAAAAAGLAVQEGRFEDVVFRADERFDAVVLSYVLEHLPSPREALARIHGLLREGGVAFASVPNVESWDRAVFGRYWHGFDAPRHFTLFSPRAMRAYAQKTGFAVEEIRHGAVPNDWIGGIARMLQSRGRVRAAAWMNYKNPVLAALFFPLSCLAALSGASSRLVCSLRRRSIPEPAPSV